MKTELHLVDADSFYEHLLNAHTGLSREQSELFNARLILILANQVGDGRILRECVVAALLLHAENSNSGVARATLGGAPPEPVPRKMP